MERVESHILAAGIIWFSALIGFLCSYTCSGSPRVLSLGNTFGGGVLLAAGLVHLTNDSFTQFANISPSSWAAVDYPWAVFFVSIGFLTTLFIEEGVLHVIAHKTEHDHEYDRMSDNDLENPLLTCNNCGAEGHAWCEKKDIKMLGGQTWDIARPTLCNWTTSGRGSDCAGKVRGNSVSEMMQLMAVMPSNSLLRTGSLKHISSLPVLETHAEDEKKEHDDSDQTYDHDHGAGEMVDRGMAIALVFLFAISCHSFLSGLGVGAMTGNDLWSGIIAVVAHKGLATFTLATCFIKADVATRTLVFYMLLFSLVTPLGIIIGSMLTSAGGATEGVLIGLAAGSFIYIGILEVISKELEAPADKMYKLGVLILGWGLMSMLAIWV